MKISLNAEPKSKYKPGDFGYWWTVTEGKEDIEGKAYKGNILVIYAKLTSLKGCPRKITGVLNCTNNKLSSLKGAPVSCTYFDCSRNALTSLEGGPKTVKSFNCSENKLTSLEGAPASCSDFDCSKNKLTSLKGGPTKVDIFYCANNKLSSLKYAPETITDRFVVTNNPLKYLDVTPKIMRDLVIEELKLEELQKKMVPLKGAPKEIDGNFDLSKMKNGKKSPSKIGTNFKR